MNATQAYAAHPHHGYMDSHHHMQSSAPPYAHYAPPAPALQPALGSHAPGPYGHQYYSYHGSVASPQSAGSQHQYSHQQSSSLPSSQAPAAAAQEYPARTPDTTGQVAPPGVKPKVTATLWEDEGTLCFQVEDNGICVARRDDNHMINGTKLLNVANMTRGRRDGILKSEKVRNVVKIGPMHLKGVWIPFERALEFANKEKITERLYPLFVHNVGALLHQPTNQNAVMSRGRDGQNQTRYVATSQAPQPPTLHHHHSMNNPVGAHVPQPPHSIAPHPSSGRPGLDRAHTFPTPPTSATSMMGMGNSGSSYEWSANTQVPTSQGLPMDSAGMGNTKSMPTTPATTPPDNSAQSMQPPYHHHHHQQQQYDSSRMYSATQPHHSQYGVGGQYAQSVDPYGKTDMAPPPSTGAGHEGISGHKDDGGEHLRYSQQHGASAYSGSQGYTYNSAHVSPSDVKGSPQQHSGRATPRTVATPQSQWQPGYAAPQRAQTLPSNSLSYIPADPRGSVPNGSYAMPNGTSSNKRARDDDDDDPYGQPIGASGHPDALKRQKTGREGSAGVSMGQGMNRARPAIAQRQ